jgi:SAM-dependent MidA family methyltransferase
VLPRLRDEIRRGGGWISFARYMELVLYEPGIGYYAGPAPKFGAQGDFVTAPQLGSLFGRTLARQLKDLPFRQVLEVGAGSGALAEVLLGQADLDYAILETSPHLQAQQQARLGDRVRWLDRLPERIRGIVIANEVVDAIPVHAVAWRPAGIVERGVAYEDELRWEERPASSELLEKAKAIDVPVPYESEIGLIAQAWMRAVAERLEEGVMFIIDYGFPRHEYYHPDRATGTVMCHYRHQAHADPFAHPGEQDVTAHVDFTALADAAVEAGLEVLGYANQAQFLVNCGITEVLGEANIDNALHYAPLAAEAQKLLSPAEMGELFKVLAVGRGVARPLLGFGRGDRTASL